LNAGDPSPAAPASARAGLLLPAVLAIVLSAALLLAQRRLDFTVNEEGFLWYGAVAAAQGDVPLRDFYSYDPGRYYWAALWSPLVGNGLLGLRTATAAFGALGLFCGLLAARRALASPLALAGAGLVLTLWLLPRNKIYESAITMAAVLAATVLVDQPSRRRHLLAGALTGFALFMGKNHGLYLGVAFLFLILLLHFRRASAGEITAAATETPATSAPPPAAPAGREIPAAPDAPPATTAWRRLAGQLATFGAGILLGATPLLAMLAFVPGFARAYLESILFFVQEGRTNFPRPVPWPWRFDFAHMPLWGAAQTLSTSSCFLLTAVFFTLGVLALLAAPGARLRRHPLLAGAIAVGAVYTHHAFSRADLAHLAPSISPLLLALLALPTACAAAAGGRRPRLRRPTGLAAGIVVALLLAAVTLATALPAQPFYRQFTTHAMRPYRVAGEDLLLRPRILDTLAWVERTAAARIPPGAPILLAPSLPGLYPILGRRAPVWDIYPIWPAAGRLDERMLSDLRRNRVAWAFLQSTAVDSRDELLFRNTHPQTWAYLQQDWDAVDASPAPGQIILLHARGVPPGASADAANPSGRLPPGAGLGAARR
jgi:hypothetical protein